MKLTAYVKTADLHPSAVPRLLWEYYLEYLWFYQPESWVARTAYAFRVVAVLAAFPFVVLMLLVRTQLSSGASIVSENLFFTCPGHRIVRYSPHAGHNRHRETAYDAPSPRPPDRGTHRSGQEPVRAQCPHLASRARGRSPNALRVPHRERTPARGRAPAGVFHIRRERPPAIGRRRVLACRLAASLADERAPSHVL
jgi:hypothetical protein